MSKQKKAENEPKNKTCFVVSRIGEAGSDIRQEADKVLNYIIKPVAKEFDYDVIRADEYSETGSINLQIVEMLLEADLVIADLTGRNPNVYYELAVRHATQKPFIHLIQQGEKPPFDVIDFRTISIEDTIEGGEIARESLKKQIQEIEEKGYIAKTPISSALKVSNLEKNGNLVESALADIMSSLSELNTRFTTHTQEVSRRFDKLEGKHRVSTSGTASTNGSWATGSISTPISNPISTRSTADEYWAQHNTIASTHGLVASITEAQKTMSDLATAVSTSYTRSGLAEAQELARGMVANLTDPMEHIVKGITSTTKSLTDIVQTSTPTFDLSKITGPDHLIPLDSIVSNADLALGFTRKSTRSKKKDE